MKKIYDKNSNLFAELNYAKEYFLNYSKHSHETLCLSIISQGEIEVLFHSKKKKSLNPKQILVFNPEQVHKTTSKTNNTQDYYSLHVNINKYKKLQKDILAVEDKLLDIKNIIEDEYLYIKLKSHFENIINKKEVDNKTLEDILINIIKKHALPTKDKPSEDENILATRTKEFILNNIDNPITLKDISLKVGYNESYVSRVFKKKFGLTPHAFLINKRLESAKNKMLDNKEINLALLSNETGFFDQSHFTKAFKRVFAMTPNKYKTNSS